MIDKVYFQCQILYRALVSPIYPLVAMVFLTYYQLSVSSNIRVLEKTSIEYSSPHNGRLAQP